MTIVSSLLALICDIELMEVKENLSRDFSELCIGSSLSLAASYILLTSCSASLTKSVLIVLHFTSFSAN